MDVDGPRTPGVPGGFIVDVARRDRAGAPAIAVRVDGFELSIPWVDPDRDAAGVVRAVTHLARWERLRRLGEGRSSSLAADIELQLFAAARGDRAVPPGRSPMARAAEQALTYGVDGAPPRLFVRLANHAPRDLWVALVDLADDLSITPLFQAQAIAAGVAVDVGGGGPVEFVLPAAVAPRPGASARDHLKVIMSEAPFDAAPFALPPLGEARRSTAEPPPLDWSAATTTVLVTVP